MSDTPTPGALAPDVPPIVPPPETKPPEPEARSPFVLVKPLFDGEALVHGAGTLVNLTDAQAKKHAALIRPALPVDVSRWGRAVPEL